MIRARKRDPATRADSITRPFWPIRRRASARNRDLPKKANGVRMFKA